MAANPKRTRLIEFKTGKIISRTRKATGEAFDTVAKQMTAVVRKDLTGLHPPASRPGSPPHIRTGFLLNNFEVVREGFKFIVRVPQYGIYLDGGTRKMAARPFIRENLMTPDKKLTWTRRINTQIRLNVAKAKNR